MKYRKLLTGMAAGIMAVSSAIVCQVSAGAVDVTLVSGAAVASWGDFEVDISKAGTATADSSLEISCPAPDGAIENQRLFNVILEDSDWDSPKYSASYDSSKSEFSVTVPGSELVGRSKVTIQGGDIGVSVTVKAVDFAEDTRATAGITLDLPTNIRMVARTDDSAIGASADYSIDITGQFSVKTYGDLLDAFKGADLPAGKYVGDSLGLGADGFEMSIGFMGRDGSGSEYWGCTNTVSYRDGGFVAIDSDTYYPGSRGDTIGEINVTIRPRMEYLDDQGKSQAVSEKVRNLKDGDVITIQTAEDTRSDVTVPAPTGGIVMYCYRDEWNDGTMANADIPAASVPGITLGKTTIKELKQTIKTISSSGKPVYTKDSLNVGKDAFSYAVWLHMKNGSQEDWWRGRLVSFDEIAAISTEDIDSGLDDYVIEEIGLTVFPKLTELPDGRSQAVSETIRSLDPDKTPKIYINAMDTADDDEDDIRYDGLGEVKAEGTRVFGKAEWDSSQLDITIASIDPGWIKTEDDVIIVKVKYNKDYYDEYDRLVIAKNDGDYSEGFAYQFGERDFNIHVRAGELMKYWNCKTVKELTGKNLTVQLWEPNEGDSVDYQISIISPKFEEKIEAPADKSEDYVPPAIELVPDKTASQTTGVKPSAKNPSEKVYDTRFVMSVSSSDLVSGAGFKMVAYITIKRLDTNQIATISTTICYDSVSAVGDTISAGNGQKLLAFAIVNIPAGVDIEYTSIIMGVADV